MNLQQALHLTRHDGQNAKEARYTLSILSCLFFASSSLASPYVNLYLKTSGLSATFIGIVLSIGAFLELSVNPVINAYADRHGKHRLVFQGQMLVLVLAVLILSVTTSPWIVAIGVMLHAMNLRGSGEMLSQLTMSRLHEFGLRIFGKVRLWGSVGWAMMALSSMPIIAMGSYPLSFLAAALVRLGIFPFINALPDKTEQKSKPLALPINKAVYVLLISQFLFFVGLNAWGQFIWIHFREGLNVAPEHLGFLAAWYAITEFIPLRYVDRVIERFGVRPVMIAGMLIMSLEWLAYGFVPNAWWILLLACVKAMGFTMFMVASTLLISDISHPSRAATNRALILVTMPALSLLLTSPLSGWIYDVYGHMTLFSFASIMGVIACVFIFSQRKRLVPMVHAHEETLTA
jgi:MFS transporter, PPP family, 3-phenylpropionic acid transporter